MQRENVTLIIFCQSQLSFQSAKPEYEEVFVTDGESTFMCTDITCLLVGKKTVDADGMTVNEMAAFIHTVHTLG